LASALVGGEWSASCSAHIIPGKETPLSNAYEPGWAPDPVSTLWSRGSSVSCSGNRTPALQPLGIPTELSRLTQLLFLVELYVYSCTCLHGIVLKHKKELVFLAVITLFCFYFKRFSFTRSILLESVIVKLPYVCSFHGYPFLDTFALGLNTYESCCHCDINLSMRSEFTSLLPVNCLESVTYDIIKVCLILYDFRITGCLDFVHRPVF
jgi:hypothetical protein